jgi:hypothetical protein
LPEGKHLVLSHHLQLAQDLPEQWAPLPDSLHKNLWHGLMLPVCAQCLKRVKGKSINAVCFPNCKLSQHNFWHLPTKNLQTWMKFEFKFQRKMSSISIHPRDVTQHILM